MEKQLDKYVRIRNRVAIDELRLSEELIQHPALLMDACDGLAEVVSARDRCENWLLLKKAEASAAGRHTDGKVPADAAIVREIPLDEDVQDAIVRLEDAKKDVGMWQSLVEAMRAKGSSLKRLSDLTISGFLSPNAAYDTAKEEIMKRRKTGK